MKKTVKKLTPRNVVLGIGRKATKEELDEYLNRERSEKFKPLAQVREEIATHLITRETKELLDDRLKKYNSKSKRTTWAAIKKKIRG